jgi:V8-like Glu-specific endopeptidase
MTDELPANPFIVGPPVPADRFIGRQREVQTILARLDNPGNRGGTAISGERRIGKTSLLHYVESSQALASCANLSPTRAKFLYLNGHLIIPLVAEQFWTSVFSVLSGCQELGGNLRVLAQSMSQEVLSKDSLVDFFCKVGEAGCLVVALFDEFDPAMDYVDPENPEFFYTLRSLLNQPSPRGFSLVVASRAPLETLFSDVKWHGSEFYNNMEMIALRPFERSEMDQLLGTYLESSGISFDNRLRNFLFSVSQGYPQAIQRGASMLFDDIVQAKKGSKHWIFSKEMRDTISAAVVRDKPDRPTGEKETRSSIPATVMDYQQQPPRASACSLPSSRRKTSLSSEDRRRLLEELNKLPGWVDGDKVGERDILLAAGLPREYVNSLTLSGAPIRDAQNVIFKLESLGHLENRLTHHALGVLVQYLLDSTPSAEGKIFLAYLLDHYQLITSLDYLKELRDEYGLLEVPTSNEIVDLGWQTEQPTFSWQGPTDPERLEAIWSKRAPFLDAIFLEKGARVARAVCRVERADYFPLGTGFLIGPDLVLTNHHVLPTDEKAEAALVRFGYRVDHNRQLKQGEVYQVSRVLRRSSIEALDYVVLKLRKAPGENAEIGYLRPVTRALQEGESLYIIQHPLGSPQKIVLQDNWITYVANDQRRVQYLTNTKRGSSGSPVGNEHWEVVALHHSGAPLPDPPETKHVRGNEGIPMAAILPGIQDLLPE